MCGGRGRAHCSCSLDLLLLSTELLRTRTSPSGHPSPPIASTAAFTQLMGLHSTVPRDYVLWSARQEDSRDSCYRPQVGASTCFGAAMANQGCFSLPCYRVLNFIRRYMGSANPLIAGNSVYTDLLFLKKYMPQLAGIFSHVIVDVSSIKFLCIRWFSKEKKEAPRKGKSHRAMDDIRESINELQYYKENIFKSQRSK